METNFNNLANLADITADNEQLKPFMEIIQSIMELSDENLTPVAIESIQGMLKGGLTPALRQQSAEQIIANYKNNNATRGEVKNEIAALKTTIEDIIAELKPSKEKEMLLRSVFNIFYEIFDEVENRYNNYDIELPMTLKGDAQVPSYAHDTDAAADLYAAETVVVPAHSLGNKISTGVNIALPEGWVAYIVPRSSIGSKTPLRLSNSIGVIDAGYRGELGILYDNISDSDYTINTGDRIAQLIVMPCYHFKAEVVDILPTSERGEGGFGSSGK